MSEGKRADDTPSDVDEAVPKLALANIKVYKTPASVSSVAADEFLILGGFLSFYIEDLSKHCFVDTYATDGSLPGEIPLEWAHTWSWRNQYVYRDADLVK